MELIITHRHYQLLNWSIVCFDFYYVSRFLQDAPVCRVYL